MADNLATRTDLLLMLTARYDNCRYLEIGCAADDNFQHIPVEGKVGVDPIRGGTRRMTSDQFFEENTDLFNVIFVDGLHTVEQATRDVENSLDALADGGVIVIHDALPPDFESTDPAIMEAAIRDDRPVDSVGMWCGEVWRVLLKLLERKDLNMVLWPHDLGCVVLRKGSQKPRKVKCDHFDIYIKRYAEWLRVVDEKELVKWLDTP